MLVDVTPDVREQVRALDRWRPLPESGNVVDHICLTHAHMGHYTGLVQFGKEAHNARAVPTWVTPSMAAFLRANQPWRTLVDDGHLDLRETVPGGTFQPAPGLRVRLVPVPHRSEFTDTVGVSVNDELLYVPDIDAWAAWEDAEAEIARHRVALLDGCFFRAGELSGRNQEDVPHPLVLDTVERFSSLAETRRLILTHLNHSNPAADPSSPEAAVVAAAGFEVAVDDLVIPLSPD